MMTERATPGRVDVLIGGGVLAGAGPAATSVAVPSVTLVRAGACRVLVDTGLFVARCRFDLVARLEGLGLAPGDITHIVYTHLHEDHCQNTVLFPGAKVLVGSEELDWMEAELPGPAAAFFLPAGRQVVPLRGAMELDAGLLVFPTPGHTAGHYSLFVPGTALGNVVVAGDAIGWRRHYLAGEAPPVVWNLAAYRRSHAAIRALRPDVIIPGHEPPFTINPSEET